MGILSAIGTGVGLLQGLGQNRGASALERQAQAERRQALARLRLYDEQKGETLRQMEASGYGDPAAQSQALMDDFNRANGVATANAALGARVAGYRPGDTGLENAVRGASRRELSNLALQQQQAQQVAYAQRLNALSLYDPSQYTNAMLANSNATMGDAQRQRVDTGALAGGFFGALGSLSNRSPKAAATATGTTPSSLGSSSSSSTGYFGVPTTVRLPGPYDPPQNQDPWTTGDYSVRLKGPWGY